MLHGHTAFGLPRHGRRPQAVPRPKRGSGAVRGSGACRSVAPGRIVAPHCDAAPGATAVFRGGASRGRGAGCEEHHVLPQVSLGIHPVRGN